MGVVCVYDIILCEVWVFKGSLILWLVFLITGFAVGADYSPMVVRWRLDETAGVIAEDCVGAVDGAVGSGNSWQDGGIYLTGENNGVSGVVFEPNQIGSLFSNIDDEITITFWAKDDVLNRMGRNRLFTGRDGQDNLLLGLDFPAQEGQIVWKCGLNNDNTSIWHVDDANYQSYVGMGQWHYYVLTKDTSRPLMQIFIDAERRSRGVTNSSGEPLNGSIAGVESFAICGVESNWHQWSGWLRDFRIYDRVLSQAEIKRAYYNDAYAADFNMDLFVDGFDLSILADLWLEGDYALADADEDGNVNFRDYSVFADAYEPVDPNLQREGWELTFQDEFDGPEIDPLKWTIGSWSTWKEEIQVAHPPDPNLLVFENGVLNLMVVKQGWQDPTGYKEYCGGEIRSAYKFDQAYGRFEARCRIPDVPAGWGAFWLMAYDANTWYPGAEIDIQEYIDVRGDEPNGVIGCNIQWNGYGEEHISLGRKTCNVPDFAEEFHIYALEWEPNELRFCVDDYVFYTHYDPGPGFDKRVPKSPLYLILGSGLHYWGDPIDDNQLPCAFEVDYVRVYKKKD